LIDVSEVLIASIIRALNMQHVNSALPPHTMKALGGRGGVAWRVIEQLQLIIIVIIYDWSRVAQAV
jgi:hypothetical protein